MTLKTTVALFLTLIAGLIAIGFGLFALPYFISFGSIFGISYGVLMIASVIRLNGSAANYWKWSALIIVLSGVGLTIGIEQVGPLLGVIGGVFLLIWRPSTNQSGTEGATN